MAAAIDDRFVLNELDWIKVKGKEDALAIYELLGERDGAEPALLAYVQQYHPALELYRAGKFAGAEACWRRIAHRRQSGASPPLIMAHRAASLGADPPPDWDGVYVKTTK